MRESSRGRRVAARALIALVAGLVAALPPASAQAQSRSERPTGAALVAALDSAARAHVDHEMVAGVSVAVVHHGRTLLQRGYGFVDLEWEVPTPADGTASYEIGSITKQFTAAVALLLAEQGKLDLDADFTTYVDFDAKGRSIPVRRLLDHTSGIKGYTEMPAFGELMVRSLPRDTLLRLVEKEPFDFEPGTALIYNNSAYFLLGLVIEEVTGKAYGAVVEELIFDPLGMEDSYYCSESEVRDDRAHGYDAAGPDRIVRARYLDHTWPYAAGSLCSTVADLVRWNLALHGGEVLSPESYRAMTTPAPLEDGTEVRYAMGLGVDASGGRRSITHGGGINGFLSDGRYYPDEDLIVVVLQNSTGPRGPAGLGATLATLVLGPLPEPPPPGAYEGDFGELTGTFRGPARGTTMTVDVLVEDGRLAFRVGDQPPRTPPWVGGLRWEEGSMQMTFIRREGRVDELRMDHGGGHYVLRRVGG